MEKKKKEEKEEKKKEEKEDGLFDEASRVKSHHGHASPGFLSRGRGCEI